MDGLYLPPKPAIHIKKPKQIVRPGDPRFNIPPLALGGMILNPYSFGGVTTAYVTGDRTASITVTQNGLTLDGAINNLVDGGFSNNNTDSVNWSGNSVQVTDFIKFNFGSAKVVDEAKWYANTTNTDGTWKWQGSNDDSGWTDIGSSFVLGGATTQTQTELNGNVTAYQYYRLLGVSGTRSGTLWHQEIEFKQN